MITLSSFIRWHAAATPDRIALTYCGAETSYDTLKTSIEKMAGLLQEQGAGPDIVVALLMKNSPAFIEAAMAIGHLGGIYLPLNFRLSSEEVAYIIEDAGAKLIIADEELAGTIPDGIARIIVTQEAQADISVLAHKVSPIEEPTHCLPSDLFRLMYTSGTTSRPKGVMHSYENFYFKSADHINILGLNAKTRLLTVGPLYHVGAFDLPGVAVLWAGGMMAIHRDFTPEAALASIEKEQLNAAWLAPVMTTALLTCPAASQHDLSSLRWVIGGGERTPESRIIQFQQIFPNARYIDAYGLTESGSGDTFMEAGRELEKIGSAGKASMHVALSIRDEQGMKLPPHEEGEICLRGPKITRGYWNDPDKTATAFFSDGWFRTGDVGYLDDEGFLFITDRKKDMIISGGENIASSEVERVLQMQPQVFECAVIGVLDKRWGERPWAVIVPAEGTVPDEEALKAHCHKHLAAFKVPDRFIIQKGMPRNASGKVLKRELRVLLSKQQES